jgi:aldehyde dehydrogenase (NAD+)
MTADTNLRSMRAYFESGVTRPYAFRRRQLLALKGGVLKYEKEIAGCLYADLKKSPEEAYATETGLLLADIRVALRHLRGWMRPRRTKINLVNLPSSGKIYPDPLGVVLIISPWNYPLQLMLIPLVGAIAAGNVVVCKPSELAPATALVLEKIIREVYPPEYVRVVQGDGAVVIPALMQSFRFDHVFYTGGAAVGKSIYRLAAEGLVPVTLELGGKSPAVVEQDAHLAVAARRIAIGKFSNAGQTCIAPDYVLVHEEVKNRLVEKLKETVVQFFGKNAMESGSYGRIINEKRFDKLVSYLPQGNLLFGGQHDRSRLFISPTIIEVVSPADDLMKEEIFGPILPVVGFTTMEEAMAIIRRNPDPLAFYLFTSDPAKERAWIEKTPFGGGCINNVSWHFANPHFPFGGTGQSGLGAYHGKYSFDTFTHAKPVMKTPLWIDPDIKYPPFKGKLKWFKLFIR